jgi:hypothetical protein
VRTRLRCLVVAAAIIACKGDTTAPVVPISGRWLAVLGGIQAELDLTQSGDALLGTAYWSLHTQSYHGVVRSGTYRPPTITLLFSAGDGLSRFDGTVINADAIQGTLRMTDGLSQELWFTRQ